MEFRYLDCEVGVMDKDEIGVGNHVGGLVVRRINGRYEWGVEDTYGCEWENISEDLYLELIKHKIKVEFRMKGGDAFA